MVNIAPNPLRRVLDPLLPMGPAAPFPKQSILEISKDSAYEAALIRLLLGTCDVADGNGVLLVRQRQNQLVLGSKRMGRITSKSVSNALVQLGIEVEDLDRYLRNSIRQQDYYRDLLLESMEYFYCTKINSHVLAFLHLYRLLERVSFAFPVIYASRSSDYKSAYASLRSFFTEKGQGELKFFRKFQEQAIDPAIRKIPVRLNLDGISGDGNGACFRQVHKLIPDGGVLSESKDQWLELAQEDLLDLIVSLRNRYFHFSSDHSLNISLAVVASPNELFSRLNGIFFNWIAFIYLNVLAKKI